MKRALPFCMSVMLIAVGTWAAVPSLVNIQGRLADPTGVNKPDGTYKLKFTLFDQAAGGNQLWTETQTSVPVKNGVFQAFLGQVTALGTTFNGAGDVYLEIQVENDPAMVPRQRIVSAPLALRAARADALGNDNDVVTVTSDDKVGIGTSNPANKLAAHDSATGNNLNIARFSGGVNTNGYNEYLSVGTASGDFAKFGFLYNSAAANTGAFISGGSDKGPGQGLFVQYGGNAGLGTTSPNASLAIASKDTTTQPALSIRADVNPAYGFDFDHEQVNVGRLDLYAVVNGARTHSMTISRQSGKVGHVGIGTTSPDAMLAVSNGDSSGWGATIEKTAGTGTPEGLLVVTSQNGSNKLLGLAQGSVGSPNYKFVVRADGKVGVGTTSPDGIMDVRGSDTILDLVRTGGSGRIFGVYSDTPKSSDSAALIVTRSREVGIRTDNPTYPLYVVGSGYAQGGTFIDHSDIRIKSNIAELSRNDVLQKVMALRGVTYDLKAGIVDDDDPLAMKKQVGVIAQEVEAVFPEVVFTDRNGQKGVAYGRMVPMLIEALKAQQAQIETLMARIQKLEANQK